MTIPEYLITRLIKDESIGAGVWLHYMAQIEATKRMHFRQPAGCFVDRDSAVIRVRDYEAMVRWFMKVGLINDEELERYLIMVTLRMMG